MRDYQFLFGIKINEDSQFVKLQLDGLAKDSNALRSRILRRIGRAIKTEIVQNELQGQILHKITGELIHNIKYKVLKKGTGMVVGAFFPAFWAGVHEHGYEQRSQTFGELRSSGRRTRKTMSSRKMTIPARPFVAPAIEKIFGTDAQRIGEEQTAKWIAEHNL
jgi:hypothetical protein